jgi:ABC-2 type transport system ATP-binding protein
MRAALGLLKPDSGRALIDGKPFRESTSPMALVGAVLDAKSAHKGRSAYNHLLGLALTNGIPRKRVDEVIALTGLESVRKRKAGSFSLGMSQRLSVAAALLGDPHNLVLDEPVNGLDPEGVKWVRELCRFYASQGRAVLLSSHLMSEVALTADNLVIIGQGRILETTSVDRFVAEHSAHAIRVVTPDPDKLRRIFEGANQVQISETARLSSDPERGAVLRITGAQLERTAQVFAQAQLVTYELIEERASLEDAYMMLTHSQVQYVTREVPGQAPVQYGTSAQEVAARQPAAQAQPVGSQLDGSAHMGVPSPTIVSQSDASVKPADAVQPVVPAQSDAPTQSSGTRADVPQFGGGRPVVTSEQPQAFPTRPIDASANSPLPQPNDALAVDAPADVGQSQPQEQPPEQSQLQPRTEPQAGDANRQAPEQTTQGGAR